MIEPVRAPTGGIAVIRLSEFTSNTARAPAKLTRVTFEKPRPVIVTGAISTNAEARADARRNRAAPRSDALDPRQGRRRRPSRSWPGTGRCRASSKTASPYCALAVAPVASVTLSSKGQDAGIAPRRDGVPEMTPVDRSSVRPFSENGP